MQGYPLRSFSLPAEGVSLCPECGTGVVTPHPLDRGSLGIHGGSSLRPMSLKWWRYPGWFPHIPEGSVGFQRAHESFGCSQSFSCPGTSPSFSIWRLLLGNSMATEWIKIQDILTCTSHFPLGRSTPGGEHQLRGEERAANTLH